MTESMIPVIKTGRVWRNTHNGDIHLHPGSYMVLIDAMIPTCTLVPPELEEAFREMIKQYNKDTD